MGRKQHSSRLSLKIAEIECQQILANTNRPGSDLLLTGAAVMI